MNVGPVAVLGGTGDLGLGLALRWAHSGVPVLLGSRDASKAKSAAQTVSERLLANHIPPASSISVTGYENAAAAAQARVIVLAVPFPAQIPILKSVRGALKNCILVDATVPLAATIGGKPTRLLGVWEGSAAEQARRYVPATVPVVGAFHNTSAERMQDISAVLDCDVLVCGDDADAKNELFGLIKLIEGLRPIDAGPLEMARIVESLTSLLISINRQYRLHHAGIRITGVNPT